MTNEFVPGLYGEELMQSFLDDMVRGARFETELRGEDPDNLETRYVEHPLPAEFLAARAEFVARWEALQEEGLAAKYLEYSHCYECAGTVEPTTKTTEYLAEPNPDYDPDKPLPRLAQQVKDGKPITFTYAAKTVPLSPDAGSDDGAA